MQSFLWLHERCFKLIFINKSYCIFSNRYIHMLWRPGQGGGGREQSSEGETLFQRAQTGPRTPPAPPNGTVTPRKRRGWAVSVGEPGPASPGRPQKTPVNRRPPPRRIRRSGEVQVAQPKVGVLVGFFPFKKFCKKILKISNHFLIMGD